MSMANGKISERCFLREGFFAFILFLILIMINLIYQVPVYGHGGVESNKKEPAFVTRPGRIKNKLPKKKLNQKDWFYTSLEVNYAMLNTLDLITTFYVLEHGAMELNPISKLYIHNKPLAVAVKAGLTAATLYGLNHVRHKNKAAAYLTLGLLNVVYGFVVKNNIGVYLQLR